MQTHELASINDHARESHTHLPVLGAAPIYTAVLAHAQGSLFKSAEWSGADVCDRDGCRVFCV